MILVTGGAGFIGQRLIRRLVDEGNQVRILIRPSLTSPELPKGVSVEAAISSLADTRGIRAALVGIDTVFHLAGADWVDPRDDIRTIEIEGTRNLLEAAQDAKVNRLIYISQLDADRAAGFPVLKAKGIAEEFIRQSPIPYTIIRSALVFGPGDRFTTRLAQLMAFSPRIFPLPGEGDTLLQPLWVEDLISCLSWSLEEENVIGKTIEIGGPEHLSYRQIIETVLQKTRMERILQPIRPSYLRVLIGTLHYLLPRLPISNLWLDYLAADRICELDNLTRLFNLMPARFEQKLEYLGGEDWNTLRPRRARRTA